MAESTIPTNDGGLVEFMRAHARMMTDYGALLGFAPAEIAEAQADAVLIETDWMARGAAETVLRAAVRQLAGSRRGVVGRTRARIRRAVQHPAMTPAIRASGAIAPPDPTRTPFDRGMIDRLDPPLVLLDQSIPGRVRIVVGTEPGNLRRNRRARGTVGVRIRFALGPNPPAGDEGWTWLIDATGSAYVHVFAGTPPGFVWFQAAWIDKRLQVGAYSDPARGNVTA